MNILKVGLLSLICSLSLVANASIEEEVSAGIRDCRGGEGSNVPFITWGADLVTISANGGSLETKEDSFFDKNGLKLKLKREDSIVNQVNDYMSCKSPWLRITSGQMGLLDFLNKDDRTKMVALLQLSWSNGGDALVSGKGIESIKDLKGKKIAVMEGGPHVDYLVGLLADEGLSVNDVKIVYTKDLTGESDDTPYMKMLEGEVDAAMVIIPDAMTLTSGGKVGTGADFSVKGATITVTTKEASRVISDMYVVRKDYFEKHKEEVQKFTNAWLRAEEEFVKGKNKDKDLIKAGALYLLDSPTALSDVNGLILDAETSGYEMNKKFFSDNNWPRSFNNLNKEIAKNYSTFGIAKNNFDKLNANWNYDQLKMGISTFVAERSSFSEEDYSAISRDITNKAMVGSLDKDTLFEFKINFKPNDNTLNAALFENEFNKVIDLMSKYAGAVVTVEGHADPLQYLKLKKGNAGKVVLSRTRQSAKNTSQSRANSVVSAIIEKANERGVIVDENQFVSIGHGFENPLTGKNGVTNEPLAPKSKEEWLSNMRVVFKIVKIQSEATEFELL